MSERGAIGSRGTCLARPRKNLETTRPAERAFIDNEFRRCRPNLACCATRANRHPARRQQAPTPGGLGVGWGGVGGVVGVLWLISSSFAATGTSRMGVDESTAVALAALHHCLNDLEHHITSAPATSTATADVRVAHASLALGQLFAAWAARDLADADASLARVTELLLSPSSRSVAWSYPAGSWTAWQSELPARMVQDATDAVQKALVAARRAWTPSPSPPSLTLPPDDWSLVGARIGSDGYWRSRTTGRVRFGHGYNKVLDVFATHQLAPVGRTAVQAAEAMLTRRHADAARDASSRLPALGVNLCTCHLNPERHLLPSLALNTSARTLKSCLTMLELAARSPRDAMRVVVLVSHKLPRWAYERHPDLNAESYSGDGRADATHGVYAQHGVQYDIDHPEAMRYMGAALTAAARLFGCHAGLDSWILANEPNFYATPSAHAANKYAAVLRAKYQGCLECLSRAWQLGELGSWEGTALAQLRDPPQPVESPLDSGGARQWLDYSQFNAKRVGEWASALHQSVRGVSSCHMTSMKLNSAPNFPASVVTNGIDRVAMVRMLDISGMDDGFPPPWGAAEGGVGYSRAIRLSDQLAFYDNRKYTCDWLHVAMSLTLLRSVAPAKLVFNSEHHLITDCCTTPRMWQRDSQLMAVRIWFVALHGQGAHMLWYWGRGHDGRPTAQRRIGVDDARQFAESALMQPLVLDSYHRTWQAIQNHADAVAAIASTRRAVWLVLSMPSYRASGRHARAIYNAVEALTFLGVPYGFIPTDGDGTRNSLRAMLDALQPTDMVLLPACTHIEPDAAEGLLSWLDRSTSEDPRLLALSEPAYAADTLAFDAHTGTHLPPTGGGRAAAALRARLPVIALQRPESLLAELERHIVTPEARLAGIRPLLCMDAEARCTDDPTYVDAFGGCAAWSDGTPCRTGYAPVNTPEGIALLIASCPVSCSDVEPACTSSAAAGVFCRAAPLLAASAAHARGAMTEKEEAPVYLAVVNLRPTTARLRLELSPPLRSRCGGHTHCVDVLDGSRLSHALLSGDRDAIFDLPPKTNLLLRCGPPEQWPIATGTSTPGTRPPSMPIPPAGNAHSDADGSGVLVEAPLHPNATTISSAHVPPPPSPKPALLVQDWSLPPSSPHKPSEMTFGTVLTGTALLLPPLALLVCVWVWGLRRESSQHRPNTSSSEHSNAPVQAGRRRAKATGCAPRRVKVTMRSRSGSGPRARPGGRFARLSGDDDDEDEHDDSSTASSRRTSREVGSMAELEIVESVGPREHAQSRSSLPSRTKEAPIKSALPASVMELEMD